MPSNSAVGAYYKGRSKRWLERQGYEVGPLEVTYVVRTKEGPVPIKRDLWGADLMAMRDGDDDVLFVQVKGGGAHNRFDLPAAMRRFSAHRFARPVRKVVHHWTRGARAPEVYEC